MFTKKTHYSDSSSVDLTKLIFKGHKHSLKRELPERSSDEQHIIEDCMERTTLINTFDRLVDIGSIIDHGIASDPCESIRNAFLEVGCTIRVAMHKHAHDNNLPQPTQKEFGFR